MAEQAEPEAVVEELQTVQSEMIVEGESVNEEANNAETTRSGKDKIVLKGLTVSNLDSIEGNEQPVINMVCENVGIDTEAESILFKIPKTEEGYE